MRDQRLQALFGGRQLVVSLHLVGTEIRVRSSRVGPDFGILTPTASLLPKIKKPVLSSSAMIATTSMISNRVKARSRGMSLR